MKKKSGALGWLLGRMHGRIYIVVILTLMNGLEAALGIAFAFMSKLVIDTATSGDFERLALMAALACGVIFVQVSLSYISAYVEERAAASFDKELKLRMFELVMHKDYAAVSSYHSGDLLTRLTNDINIISGSVIGLLPAFVGYVVTLALGLIGLIRLDLRFGLIFLIGGALFLTAVRLLGKYIKAMHKKVQAAVSSGNSFFQESISNLLMIKVFGIESVIYHLSEKLQSKVRREKNKRSGVFAVSYMGASLLFSIGGLYALIWSAYRLAVGAITFGTLTAIIQLVNRVQSPVAEMTSVISRVFSITASAERIMEIEALPEERSEVNLERSAYSEFTEIRFRNVSFSYDRLPVISDASFSVHRGSFAVIRGHSGIGKSTLLKLLLGVYKAQFGEILIDVGGEHYAAGCGTRPLFAYVPQGNMIFSGTIRDTVTMVDPYASDEDIMAAAEICCAADFIKELPDGLDTVIGENGLGLSEGQVQRLAITRAILSKAGILLLDEATSALDEQTEEKLLRNLRSLGDKTCIIITHRPSAFAVCDEIISIEDGVVSTSIVKSQMSQDRSDHSLSPASASFAASGESAQ